jgi:hypothetical protein
MNSSVCRVTYMPEIEVAEDGAAKSSFSFTSWNAVPKSYHEHVLEGGPESRKEIHVLHEPSEKEFLESMAQAGWYIFRIVRVTEDWIDFFFSRHPRSSSHQLPSESIIDQHFTFKPIPEPTLEHGAWG